MGCNNNCKSSCNSNCNSNCNQSNSCPNSSNRADHQITEYWSNQFHSSEDNLKPKKCVCPPFGTSPKYFTPIQVPCDCNCKCWCNNKCNCNNCCPCQNKCGPW